MAANGASKKVPKSHIRAQESPREVQPTVPIGADSLRQLSHQPPIAADSFRQTRPATTPIDTYRHLSAAIGTKTTFFPIQKAATRHPSRKALQAASRSR